MPVTLYEADCLAVLASLASNSIDAVCTDAPYHLTQLSRGGSARVNDPNTPFGRTRLGGDRGFMASVWDGGDIAFRPETWGKVLRVMKPGAHLLSFGGTRTFHRMAVAIEDAGFELREMLMWLYGSGFNKVGYIRDQDGNQVQEGWAGSLKPAYEPIVLARKPLDGNTVNNMLSHGTGALNVDACRVPLDPDADQSQLRTMQRGVRHEDTSGQTWGMSKHTPDMPQVVRPDGRWPSNLIHDGSDEVMDVFASFGEKKSGVPGMRRKPCVSHSMAGPLDMTGEIEVGYADTGSVARFFQSCPYTEDEEALRIHYCSKANKRDRYGSKHPTVKPISLMRYLVKLITPPGGVVLDPFAGSGTTGQAAAEEGFDAILIEREPEYCQDIRRRVALYLEHDRCV